MEAQVAGKLGLKDASAKALAAAGSFKFDETNQRLFDDILMQRRQVCLCARACACVRLCVSHPAPAAERSVKKPQQREIKGEQNERGCSGAAGADAEEIDEPSNVAQTGACVHDCGCLHRL
jgi:hypothetical protein